MQLSISNIFLIHLVLHEPPFSFYVSFEIWASSNLISSYGILLKTSRDGKTVLLLGRFVGTKLVSLFLSSSIVCVDLVEKKKKIGTI